MAHRRDTTARRQELFEEAAAIIAFEYAEPLTLDEVARRLFTSPRQLQRAFAEGGDGSFRSHLCRSPNGARVRPPPRWRDGRGGRPRGRLQPARPVRQGLPSVQASIALSRTASTRASGSHGRNSAAALISLNLEANAQVDTAPEG